MTRAPRGHVVGVRPLVVAMAAAGSSVVRRVEELGDLAQAHIQQLSEAAGEDGEGAGRGRRKRGQRLGAGTVQPQGLEAAACGAVYPVS